MPNTSISLYWFSNGGLQEVTIYAPKLVCLTMEGQIAENYHLGSFNSLQSASIFAKTNLVDVLCANYASTTARNAYEILQSVKHAKELGVGILFLEVLFTKIFPSTSLHNVQSLNLQLTPDSEKNHFPIIASFLQRLPNLQSLVMRTCFGPPSIGYDSDDDNVDDDNMDENNVDDDDKYFVRNLDNGNSD
ncbi:hypothetical protein JCGZ_06953 [Jatropha curcas]|uniref:Uncharacterized protein n=1 Tax=Jatropha curcas TaxID=180498 RepID=A0A067KZD0_JATCU|nr:hypothetical protein JCGZ_06953 [Jatropha curcas]